MQGCTILGGAVEDHSAEGDGDYSSFFGWGDTTKEKTVIYEEEVDINALIAEKNLSTIYLAGGCFWGVEEYMSRIGGVYDVLSGYANGTTENPSYEEVIYEDTGHAETVRVVYDPNQVTLTELLDSFFKVVDPTTLNRQGNDVGTQYRSGIYYTDESDVTAINDVISRLDTDYNANIVVEVLPLDNFYDAEDYHQDYLIKNENGYCHIDLSIATADSVIDPTDYPLPDADTIREMLTPLQYEVTQLNGTERSYTSELDAYYEVGIYVDIVTGEPLFLSTDKYDSGTGWPSFTKPITDEVILEFEEEGLWYSGTEVKSRTGLSHLGHVFEDGPSDRGGLRYCINGAALRFIPYNSMTVEGYAYLKHLIREDSSITVR